MYLCRIVFVVQSTLFCFTYGANDTLNLNNQDAAKSFQATSGAQYEVPLPMRKPSRVAVKRMRSQAEIQQQQQNAFSLAHRMTQEILQNVELVRQKLSEFDLSILNEMIVNSIVLMKQELKKVKLQLSDMENKMPLKIPRVSETTEMDQSCFAHQFKEPLPKRIPDPITNRKMKERANEYKHMQALAIDGVEILETALDKLDRIDRLILDEKQLESIESIKEGLQMVRDRLVDLEGYLLRKEQQCNKKIAVLPDTPDPSPAGPKPLANYLLHNSAHEKAAAKRRKLS